MPIVVTNMERVEEGGRFDDDGYSADVKEQARARMAPRG